MFYGVKTRLLLTLMLTKKNGKILRQTRKEVRMKEAKLFLKQNTRNDIMKCDI